MPKEKGKAVVYLDDLEAEGKSAIFFRTEPNDNFENISVNLCLNPNTTLKHMSEEVRKTYPTAQVWEYREFGQTYYVVLTDKVDVTNDSYWSKTKW